MALVGYARVSTAEQNPDLQEDALKAAGCFRVLIDRAGGAVDGRPELGHALDVLRPGDVLVVWRLDRLGRSLRGLLDAVADIERRGAGLRSLQEAIDTTTAGGRLIFHVFAALAEFERGLIRERTHAGLAAARARGRPGGRPRSLTPEKIAAARQLREAGGASISSIARAIGVSRASVYRCLEIAAPADGGARRAGAAGAPRD